jgi:DNA replication protein DnaC
MTAFLKIDQCINCHRALPWGWVPAVCLNGKTLAGTGVWHSELVDGRCPGCHAALEREREKEKRSIALRKELTELLGGEKPYREFTFGRYQTTPGNQLAFTRCKQFNPATENLYLWGACGVGKTHLAYATARICFEEGLTVAILPAAKLSRKVRTTDPAQEQSAIDELVGVDLLVLDDLGTGTDTAYSRQLLQEILDGRDFQARAGLVITGKYSLNSLASKMDDDSIPSRLAGMCQVVRISGPDHRLKP